MTTPTSEPLTSLTLVVGVEDELVEGCLKVYVAARYLGLYVLIRDPGVQREVRDAWRGRGHLLISLPPQGHFYRDDGHEEGGDAE